LIASQTLDAIRERQCLTAESDAACCQRRAQSPYPRQQLRRRGR
jgi:hypothetical protein